MSHHFVAVNLYVYLIYKEMRDIKLPQVGLELARLLRTKHKFVCFDVTSRVDIECAGSSLCQAP